MADEQKRLEEGALKDRGISRNLSSDDLESNGKRYCHHYKKSMDLQGAFSKAEPWRAFSQTILQPSDRKLVNPCLMLPIVIRVGGRET